MKIASVHTRVVRAPYRRPFVISSGTSPELVSLVVEVRTADGLSGFGEASPMTAYTGETLAGLEAALTDHAAPALIGRDPRDLAGAHLAMDRAIRGQHLAKAALDIALHDLSARAAGRPVHLLLGGCVRPRVPTTWVVGLGTVDEMVKEAAEYATRGFTHIKVKGARTRTSTSSWCASYERCCRTRPSSASTRTRATIPAPPAVPSPGWPTPDSIWSNSRCRAGT